MSNNKLFIGLVLGMGVNLSAAAQQVPAEPKFWMTLSNKTRLMIDCGKLVSGQKTMAFMAQFEPYTEAQISALTPQQQVWIKMTRESRATDHNMIENITKHLDEAHGVKRKEIDAAHQLCLTQR